MARIESHRSLTKLIAFVKQRCAHLSGPTVLITDTIEHPAVSYFSSSFPRLIVLLPEIADRAGLRTMKASSPEEGSLALSEIGSPIAVVDVRSVPSGERSAWFEWLFFHVALDGFYLAPRGEDVSAAWLEAATSTVQHRGPAQLKELDISSGTPQRIGEFIAVPKVQAHMFKLKEENANRYLPQREGISNFRIVAGVPGGRFEATTKIYEHGGRALPKARWDYHESYVRHVRGNVQLLADGLAVKGNTILPSSFRHARARDVKNDSLRSLNQEFGVLNKQGPPRYLEGKYYDLSSTLTGHFGHFITETVAKLWGWEKAKREMPDLKALYRSPAVGRQPDLENALFTAYGISADDLVIVDEDVQVDEYVWSSYLWQNLANYHFHPRILDTWKILRAGLVDFEQASPARVFVSRSDRSSDNRSCRNVDALEARFAAAGYTVVFPELLSFKEQATLFGNAKQIAGLAGSAMFNMLFAEKLQRVIVLSHNSYTARNEFLYSTALADELHYFWSRADLQHGKKGFSTEAFHSPWEFDFDQHDAALTRVLAET